MQRVVVAAVAKAPTAVAAADPAAAPPEPDDAVKDARSEAEPLPHVTQQHVPLDVSVHRLVQHGGGDVDAHPRVASLGQDVCRAGGREGGAAVCQLQQWLVARAKTKPLTPGQPATAANVENELALALWQLQQLDATLRHLRLDADHARVVRVLAGLPAVGGAMERVSRGCMATKRDAHAHERAGVHAATHFSS